MDKTLKKIARQSNVCRTSRKSYKKRQNARAGIRGTLHSICYYGVEKYDKAIDEMF